MIPAAAHILNGIPKDLRDPLFASYQEIVANYIQHKWEPSELNGGKFCEIVYTIIKGNLDGSYPSKPTKPKNMLEACSKLEQISSNITRVGDRSLRILIPRILIPIYEIRNNRGVGHVGGDVDPNYLDATAVYGMTSWVLAELVRIFHGVTTTEAQEVVNALTEHKHPLIWEIGSSKRVLDPSLAADKQTLLLLSQTAFGVTDKDLSNWVEYSSLSMFRTRVLKPLHKARLIEYDKKTFLVHISPLGIINVNQNIIKKKI